MKIFINSQVLINHCKKGTENLQHMTLMRLWKLPLKVMCRVYVYFCNKITASDNILTTKNDDPEKLNFSRTTVYELLKGQRFKIKQAKQNQLSLRKRQYCFLVLRY